MPPSWPQKIFFFKNKQHTGKSNKAQKEIRHYEPEPTEKAYSRINMHQILKLSETIYEATIFMF